VNAVAPGVVDTPLHRNTPRELMERLSPMGRPSTVREIADAVLCLTDAATITGHILYVDGGAPVGHWSSGAVRAMTAKQRMTTTVLRRMSAGGFG
jgi:NAD(P)-dependent dehydrogenase (short-subunit alcohol dehydrogenase family)